MRRRSSTGADLVVIPVGDDAAADLPTPATDSPSRRGWERLAALAIAAIAVGALVMIAVEQRDQARLIQHQTCISDAEAAAAYGQTQGPAQGPTAAAIARCFSNPRVFLAGTMVVVPGVVSVSLGPARNDLAAVGLRIIVTSGPSTANAYITSQAPVGGTSVPGGTVISVTTRSA